MAMTETPEKADIIEHKRSRSIYETMRLSYSRIELMNDKTASEMESLNLYLSNRNRDDKSKKEAMTSANTTAPSLINLKAVVSP
jgi:hypothetical protein